MPSEDAAEGQQGGAVPVRKQVFSTHVLHYDFSPGDNEISG